MTNVLRARDQTAREIETLKSTPNQPTIQYDSPLKKSAVIVGSVVVTADSEIFLPTKASLTSFNTAFGQVNFAMSCSFVCSKLSSLTFPVFT